MELKVEGEAMNVVEEEMKENEAKESLDFFETIATNLKIGSCKNLTKCWYLDASAMKHVLGNKSSFKGLKSFVKIQNVKSARGQIHGVYGKEKMKLSSISRKTKTISNLFVSSFVIKPHYKRHKNGNWNP